MSYPNSTHITQPCDTSIFGPLKRAWPNEVRKYERETEGSISLVDFVKIVKRVHDKVMKPEAVINGFRMCGIFPLNADNVHFDRCVAVAVCPSIVSPIVGEGSNDATIIAVASKENEIVEPINMPNIDNVFTTNHDDWDVALQQPFLIDTELIPLENVENLEVTGNDNSSLNILNRIKSDLAELRCKISNERPEINSSLDVMNNLCNFLVTVITSDNSSTTNCLQSSSKEHDLPCSLNEQLPQKKTVAEILKRPPRIERTKTHRKYGKLPKFGVMSSEEVVKQFEEDQIEKENFKENKLKRQRDIKELQAKIKGLRQTQKVDNTLKKEQNITDSKRLKTSQGRKRKADALRELPVGNLII